MEYVRHLLISHSPAQSLLALSLVIALGLLLGSFRVAGFSLGIAGVLFSGILLANLGLSIETGTLEMLRELGLVFFVYTIGMQLGPGFVNAFKRQGMRLNLLAAFIAISGCLLAYAFIALGLAKKEIVVGLLCGATTNTPSLAAAQEALKNASAADTAFSGVGYAVAYPFGILGIILSMILIKLLFRVRIEDEVLRHENDHSDPAQTIDSISIEITNPNLDNHPVKDIPFFSKVEVVLSRIHHQGHVSVITPETRLFLGDVVLAVGRKEHLDELHVILGKISPMDIRSIPSQISTKRMVVTRKSCLGKSLDSLGFLHKYGVTFTRLIRSDIQIPISSALKLQYADILLAVGPTEALDRCAKELGNAPTELNHPQLIPVFVGIFLGLFLGSLPIHVPGIPAPVKLGLAGGPLIVALIFSRMGNLGSLVWYMPSSANFMLRELGITLFLACVGLKSGPLFFSAVAEGSGGYWMILAASITVVPLLLAGVFARYFLKMNFLTLCGLLSGSLTDPPALAFANAMGRSNAAGIAYASVYPLVMVLRILSVQLLVLLVF